MRIGLLAAAVVAGLSGQAQAGPDATTKWLMNDPVSMLDLGILKIEQSLRNPNRSNRPYGSVRYDWDKNRIVIYYAGYFPTTDDPEEHCAGWFTSVRSIGGVDASGNPLINGRTSFSFMFEHAGFNRSDVPENLFTELDKLFELECWHKFDGTNFRATAPFVGVGYSVEKLPKP